jgi:hypothetical protein
MNSAIVGGDLLHYPVPAIVNAWNLDVDPWWLGESPTTSDLHRFTFPIVGEFRQP